MAICSVSSSNPELSYVVVKNPTSPMLVKSVRRGRGFGFFDRRADQNRYVMFFKDAETEVSFKAHPNEDFEHVNTTRYDTALWPLVAISDFLDSALKKESEHDRPGFKNVFEMNMILVSNYRYLAVLAKHFARIGFEVIDTPVCKDHYRIVVSTETRTIRELLNAVLLLALTLVTKNDTDYLPIDEGNLAKYMRAVETIDAPYNVRGLIRSNFMRPRKLYEKFLGLLNMSKSHGYSFVYGDAATARLEFMKANLPKPLTGTVLDFGCGEGRQTMVVAEDHPEIQVVAVDKDEDCRAIVTKRADRKSLTNIQVEAALTDAQDKRLLEDLQLVLAMEVLEHMPYAESAAYMAGLLKLGAPKVLLTLPNGAFNRHLGITDDEFRHDDHHWEPNFESLVGFLNATVTGYDWTISGVGDIVTEGDDAQAMSWGIVLTKKEETVNV